MALWPGNAASPPMSLDVDAVRELAKQRWYGKANRLSTDEPVNWEGIDQVSASSRKP